MFIENLHYSQNNFIFFKVLVALLHCRSIFSEHVQVNHVTVGGREVRLRPRGSDNSIDPRGGQPHYGLRRPVSGTYSSGSSSNYDYVDRAGGNSTNPGPPRTTHHENVNR